MYLIRVNRDYYLVGLLLVVVALIVSACSGGAVGSARKVFEDLHAASVYYVAQDEEATELGQNAAGDTVVQVCYQIRRDLGAPFQDECAYLTMHDNNGNWVPVLMYDGDQGDQGCWTSMEAGKEILASAEWLDRAEQAMAAPNCP